MDTGMFIMNLGIAVLGIVFIVWINTVKAGRGAFVFKTWIDENVWTIAMSMVGISLAATLQMTAPETLTVFHTLTGVDLTNTLGGWFSFSILMYEGIRKFSSSKSKKP